MDWGGGDFTNISRTPTNIVLVTDDEYDTDTPMTISGTLTTNNEDIIDTPVTIQVIFDDESTYTMHDYTNSEGIFDTTIPSVVLMEGTCTIQAIYKGNQQYKPTTTTETTTIGGGANLTIDNNEYKITLQANTTDRPNNGIDIILTNQSTDENTTIQDLGFNTRRGNALWLNENTNETIEADLQINNTTPEGNVGYDGQTIMSNQTLQDNDKITITLTHKDQNQNTIQTITKKATYHKNLT